MMLIWRPNSQNGFTLIEVLVVLSIMGLVAALLAPNLARKPAGLERARLRGALAAKVQESRTQAVMTGTLVRFAPETLEPDIHFSTVPERPDQNPPATFYPDGSASRGFFVLGDQLLAELDPLRGGVGLREK
jgi:prepilin-type N-terminal cleavage/methylation domain-containing protein